MNWSSNELRLRKQWRIEEEEEEELKNNHVRIKRNCKWFGWCRWWNYCSNHNLSSSNGTLSFSFSFFFSLWLCNQFNCNFFQVNTRQQTERTLKRNKQSLPSNSTTAPGTLLQIFQVQFLLFFLGSVYDGILIIACDPLSGHWNWGLGWTL